MRTPLIVATAAAAVLVVIAAMAVVAGAPGTTPGEVRRANAPDIVAIALELKPDIVCIVPEKREERTTEGGLDAFGQHNHLQSLISRLADAGAVLVKGSRFMKMERVVAALTGSAEGGH